MRKFSSRLDAWLDKVIDIESFFPGRQIAPVPLKLIFDNLRYYPVLAFMWVGVRLLREQTWWLAWVAAALLGALTIGLAWLVAYQTAWTWITAFVAAVMSFISPEARQRVMENYEERNEWLFGVVALVTLFVIACAAAISTAIISALSRTNLL